MIGIYFSGTGNSKYCLHKFLEEYGNNSPAFSIEQEEAISHIKNNSEIVISYPVQFIFRFADRRYSALERLMCQKL